MRRELLDRGTKPGERLLRIPPQEGETPQSKERVRALRVEAEGGLVRLARLRRLSEVRSGVPDADQEEDIA